MKRIFILLILSLTIQYSFGQACGIYIIKYVGKIESESSKVEKIKLPTIEHLYNFEKEDSEKSFVIVELNGNEINKKIISPLGSVFENSKKLMDYFKSKRETFPVTIVINKNGKEIEITKHLNWENIEIKLIEDDGIVKSFELNIKTIEIE
ncbi:MULTISPECIES: hypothetical protein [Lacinutrix]|uniref:hypothetical protein n=1 Tax=Lacinutrix algicola TaxID=342954 RepID=UPI0006E31D22|nr:hypothetical protein [Lacinutrix algicola]